MILNVSGRTDIVAFYCNWFINRYTEGFVDVRNPFNFNMVSRIYFEDVDLILFCTKNPIPIIKYLGKIDKPLLFHVTITPYNEDIEPNVPSKRLIINGIKELSSIVGIDHLVIRYDPIFLSDKYDLEYHKRAFKKLCNLLKGYVNVVIVSFMDDYKNVRRNKKILNYRDLTEYDYEEIGVCFSKIAKENGMTVQTCFEDINLVEYGFVKGDCLSHELAFELTGKANFKSWTARKGKACHCVEMVDVGVYNTCKHFCRYCYANFDEKKVNVNYGHHYPNSSLLIGEIGDNDIVKVRR